MKSQLNTNSLKRLKQALPPNGMQEISQKLNVSLSTVSRAINGKNHKWMQKVVQEALIIIDREKGQILELNKKIEKL